MKTIYLIETPRSKENNYVQLYKKSIIRVAKEKNIKVEEILVENQKQMDKFNYSKKPILIFEPCEFIKPLLYHNLEKDCTAEVTANYCCKKFNDYKNVLIINRSELIGKPLMNFLLDEDFTVSVAHSKTSIDALNNLIKFADIIILATGKNMEHLDLTNKIVIDISDGYSNKKEITKHYISMKKIGALTTEYMLDNINN